MKLSELVEILSIENYDAMRDARVCVAIGQHTALDIENVMTMTDTNKDERWVFIVGGNENAEAEVDEGSRSEEVSTTTKDMR